MYLLFLLQAIVGKNISDSNFKKAIYNFFKFTISKVLSTKLRYSKFHESSLLQVCYDQHPSQ